MALWKVEFLFIEKATCEGLRGICQAELHLFKRKEVHLSNANANTLKHARAIEYPKMADEVDVLLDVLSPSWSLANKAKASTIAWEQDPNVYRPYSQMAPVLLFFF